MNPKFPNTFPTAFPERIPFRMEVYDEKWKFLHGKVVELGKGYPRPDTPKSWKQIGHIDGPASSYSTMRLYVCRRGYRYEQYRDGCFYPFQGSVTIAQQQTI